jgi:hypothetical protein
MQIELKQSTGEIDTVNSDYIINLHVKKHETKFLVFARMISGEVIPLTEHLSEQDAKKEYKRIFDICNEKTAILREAK